MKYSVFTAVTLLATSSLGMPDLSSRASMAAPGNVVIRNNMAQPVQLNQVAGEIIVLRQGQTLQLPPTTKPSVDLMLGDLRSPRSQVQVNYASSDQGTYTFVIRPVEGGGFPGRIEVLPLPPRPPQCHALVWSPRQGSTEQAACLDGTPIRVILRDV